MRAVAASFNAIAMVALAFALTGGSFANVAANTQIWGSAAAAVTAAIVVLTNGPAALGWIAIGYILFAALLREPPALALLLLAVAYMPILSRPRGSLLSGIGLTVVTALLFRLVL
ncbi:MAG: hypothetical protein HYY42_04675 [Chloroflexi bacterium]|nr:hypothetical protein [Chloroflexota bacterium]MBI2983458.1 hypothetical protein [Chloroflexota bacterium]